jgi:hypothetical protein
MRCSTRATHGAQYTFRTAWRAIAMGAPVCPGPAPRDRRLGTRPALKLARDPKWDTGEGCWQWLNHNSRKTGRISERQFWHRCCSYPSANDDSPNEERAMTEITQAREAMTARTSVFTTTALTGSVDAHEGGE